MIVTMMIVWLVGWDGFDPHTKDGRTTDPARAMTVQKRHTYGVGWLGGCGCVCAKKVDQEEEEKNRHELHKNICIAGSFLLFCFYFERYRTGYIRAHKYTHIRVQRHLV